MKRLTQTILLVAILVGSASFITNNAEASRIGDVWVERLSSYVELSANTGRNILIKGTNKYLNFGSVSGSSGYGFRDNAGTIEVKGSGGTWGAVGSGGGGTGTVTSVSQTVPTGFTVTGSPITTSGTLAITYATGYEGLLTADKTNWNSFYTTPSSRVTAGTGLSWTGNTVNAEVQASDLHSALTLGGTGTYVSLVGQVLTVDPITESDISDLVHTVDTSADTICTIAGTYLDGIGACNALDPAGTDNSTNVTLSGAYNYLTLTGQDIAIGQVDVATDITGILPIVNGGTGASTALSAFDLLKQTATAIYTGVVELATITETTTGTDVTRAVTPDSLAGSDFGKKSVSVVVLDSTTAITVADGLMTFPIPDGVGGMNLIGAHAYVNTAGTTGTQDIQIYNATQLANMLSTVITIDSTEISSRTALTQPVIDTLNDDVADGDILRIDSKAIQTTPASGLMIELVFQRP